jgi:hypothetical protein
MGFLNNVLLLAAIIYLAPATGEIIFYHDFEDESLHTYTKKDLKTTWNSRNSVYPGAVIIVQDPDPSGSHGKVMRVLQPANNIQTHNGGAGWRTKIGSYDELYLAYDVYFEDDAEFVLGGKLPALGIRDYYSSAGVPPDGTDRWTGGLMWTKNGKVTSYIYHANQPGPYGEQFAWYGLDGTRLRFQKGKWNRIEMYYKMNTPGVLDGRLKGWFNGELALDTDQIMYRMPGGEHLTIGGLAIKNYYGGGDLSWAPTTDQHIYFDNFVVSTQPLRNEILTPSKTH